MRLLQFPKIKREKGKFFMTTEKANFQRMRENQIFSSHFLFLHAYKLRSTLKHTVSI